MKHTNQHNKSSASIRVYLRQKTQIGMTMASASGALYAAFMAFRRKEEDSTEGDLVNHETHENHEREGELDVDNVDEVDDVGLEDDFVDGLEGSEELSNVDFGLVNEEGKMQGANTTENTNIVFNQNNQIGTNISSETTVVNKREALNPNWMKEGGVEDQSPTQNNSNPSNTQDNIANVDLATLESNIKAIYVINDYPTAEYYIEKHVGASQKDQAKKEYEEFKNRPPELKIYSNRSENFTNPKGLVNLCKSELCQSKNNTLSVLIKRIQEKIKIGHIELKNKKFPKEEFISEKSNKIAGSLCYVASNYIEFMNARVRAKLPTLSFEEAYIQMLEQNDVSFKDFYTKEGNNYADYSGYIRNSSNIVSYEEKIGNNKKLFTVEWLESIKNKMEEQMQKDKTEALKNNQSYIPRVFNIRNANYDYTKNKNGEKNNFYQIIGGKKVFWDENGVAFTEENGYPDIGTHSVTATWNDEIKNFIISDTGGGHNGETIDKFCKDRGIKNVSITDYIKK